MFSINDALRHAERRRVFNVDELCRLAVQSVDRSPDDILDFAKLAEGGYSPIFLITMRGGARLAPGGWVPTKQYEEAMARCVQMKEDALATSISPEERAEVTNHWPRDDIDGEKYE